MNPKLAAALKVYLYAAISAAAALWATGNQDPKALLLAALGALLAPTAQYLNPKDGSTGIGSVD